MPPRAGPTITKFSTTVLLASSMASPFRWVVVLVICGSDDAPDETITGGPLGIRDALDLTTGGPSPMRRWPGNRGSPPLRTVPTGAGSIMIVSPGPYTVTSWEMELNGALALP